MSERAQDDSLVMFARKAIGARFLYFRHDRVNLFATLICVPPTGSYTRVVAVAFAGQRSQFWKQLSNASQLSSELSVRVTKSRDKVRRIASLVVERNAEVFLHALPKCQHHLVLLGHITPLCATREARL
jgi:hypothetical protein